MHRCRVAPPLKAPSHLNPADCPAKEVVAIVAAVSKYASTLQVAIRPSLFTPLLGGFQNASTAGSVCGGRGYLSYSKLPISRIAKAWNNEAHII
jgi:hypothetical protein